MKKRITFQLVSSMFIAGLGFITYAADVVSDKSIGMELARDIANETILACRKDGYHVSAVVVDRHGLVRATLRDDLASRFTLEIAERKANMTSWPGLTAADLKMLAQTFDRNLTISMG